MSEYNDIQYLKRHHHWANHETPAWARKYAQHYNVYDTHTIVLEAGLTEELERWHNGLFVIYSDEPKGHDRELYGPFETEDQALKWIAKINSPTSTFMITHCGGVIL